MTNRDIAVVIVAAGKGERLGADRPKAFVEVDGQPLLAHALERTSELSGLAQLIVAVATNFQADTAKLLETTLINTPHFGQFQMTIVVGGDTRQQSVANAIGALRPEVEIVLIHDAARAFQPTDVFERVANVVRSTGDGVIPVDVVSDTIKRIDGDLVLETIDRATLRKAQTPQGFLAKELQQAYAVASSEFTDDAALWQANGGLVRFVDGDVDGHKITIAQDLADLERTQTFVGIGTDTHRFTDDAAKKLYLGTVEWPGERGLDGHSDGDAVSHAIVDALLSAVGLGDIGSQFGVDRPEFAGANGQVFLNATRELLAEKGFSIGNVSVQIIGNRPKVAPHRERAEKALSAILGCPVAITATTTDGLGFLGNSEGVAAVSSALVVAAKGRLGA